MAELPALVSADRMSFWSNAGNRVMT